MEFEVCDWCDDITLVGKYSAIGGGSDPVHICGLCIQTKGHMYEPFTVPGWGHCYAGRDDGIRP